MVIVKITDIRYDYVLMVKTLKNTTMFLKKLYKRYLMKFDISIEIPVYIYGYVHIFINAHLRI